VNQTVVQAYRDLYAMAHGWMEGTVEGLSNDEANWQPGGTALSAGAHYAHHTQTEDFFFNVLLGGGDPLMATQFAGRIGTATPAPGGDWSEWAQTTHVDMAQARSYAQAVYAATDAYLAGISDEETDEEIDCSAAGLGTRKRSFIIALIAGDTFAHCGEISTVKGLQGLSGYPF
jgi:uncharacterized damage-inducible protein DinB